MVMAGNQPKFYTNKNQMKEQKLDKLRCPPAHSQQTVKTFLIKLNKT